MEGTPEQARRLRYDPHAGSHAWQPHADGSPTRPAKRVWEYGRSGSTIATPYDRRARQFHARRPGYTQQLAPMNVKRITRLLKLLQTLQSGSGQNADGLAKHCDVSRRTMFRDLRLLRQAGVPVSNSTPSRDRYSIPGALLPPTREFHCRRGAVANGLGHRVGKSDRFPISRTGPFGRHEARRQLAGRACANSSATSPKRFKFDRLQSAPSTISAASITNSSTPALSGRVVRIQYDSLTEWEVITTKLRTYQMLFCRHSWYAIGRSSLHGEVRTFNVSRILSLETLPRPIHRPQEFYARTSSRKCVVLYSWPRTGRRDRRPLRPLVAAQCCGGQFGTRHNDSNSKTMARCSSTSASQASTRSSGGFWDMATKPQCSSRSSCGALLRTALGRWSSNMIKLRAKTMLSRPAT